MKTINIHLKLKNFNNFIIVKKDIFIINNLKCVKNVIKIVYSVKIIKLAKFIKENIAYKIV